MSSSNFVCYTQYLALTYSNVSQQLSKRPRLEPSLGSNDRGVLSGSSSSSDSSSCDQLPACFSSTQSFSNAISERLARMGKLVTYQVVSTETHKDGTPHYHAGIHLKSRWRIRDPNCLDIEGIHPNVQSARDFQAWVTYVKKDGHFVEIGEPPLERKNKQDRLEPSELIQKAKDLNQADFLAYCSVHKYTFAKDIWNMVHEDNSMTIIGENFEGTISSEFQAMTASLQWEKNLTLLLVGESGIGKTTWAKKNIPKPALMVTHIDDLRKFKPGYHVAILFDDVSITHLPETSQIHLVDYDNARSLHCRYGTARIPPGTAKIFTCNTIPVSISIKAIQRRTQLLSCFENDLAKFRVKTLLY